MCSAASGPPAGAKSKFLRRLRVWVARLQRAERAERATVSFR